MIKKHIIDDIIDFELSVVKSADGKVWYVISKFVPDTIRFTATNASLAEAVADVVKQVTES